MQRLVPSPIGKHKGILIGGIGALILLLLSAVYGQHGLVHLRHLQARERELEQLTFQLQQRNEKLRQRIRRLESDDALIERLARERLGLVKKGDLIYRVQEPRVPAP
jgi:cell division protein FtsB